MKTANQVAELIKNWSVLDPSKAEMIVKIAEACMGWPYVFGGYGQYCTSANRKSYAERGSCPAGESAVIKKKCQILNSGASSCGGCKYYPGGTVRFFDCRGFTRWVLQQVGLSLQGAGATSQWNTASNWSAKGEIKDMPKDQVCCIFMQNQKDHKTMEHTGFHVGGGVVIHCSGEVKTGKITDKGWTHYAIPAGLNGTVPVPSDDKTSMPTIRKGSKGEYVTLLQTKLLMLGYDLGKYGADGSFGSKTQEAVIKFQRDRGLTADGIVGAKTWKALEQGSAKDELYTVTVPHLHKTEADELAAKYVGASVTKE